VYELKTRVFGGDFKECDFLSSGEGREIFVTKLRQGISQSALGHSQLDAHLGKSNTYGFRVQDRNAHFSLKVFGRYKGWNNRATERNDTTRAARFDGGAHDLNGTSEYFVYSLLSVFVVEADCRNIFDEALHAVGAKNLPCVSDVFFEGRDNRDRVGKNQAA
jgi:hypothetical protein